MSYTPTNPLTIERRRIGQRLQKHLPVLLDERTVAKIMRLSRTMVNNIATEALYKCAIRMKQHYGHD